MSRVIVISRQLGTGAIEIGTKLAKTLKFAYYDKEIVNMLSNEDGFSDENVEKFCSYEINENNPICIGRDNLFPVEMPSIKTHIKNTSTIKSLIALKDSVIVGNGIDHIQDDTFRVFIYSSDMDKRIKRCKEEMPDLRDKTYDEMCTIINNEDESRARHYSYYTGRIWGQMTSHSLCIDVGVIPINTAVNIIATAIIETAIKEEDELET